MENSIIGLKTLARILKVFIFYSLLSFVSCEEVDDNIDGHTAPADSVDSAMVTLDDVAQILSSIPVGLPQVGEVHDAVTASASNGYDEEYTMGNIFAAPGSGVGDDRLFPATKATSTIRSYQTPLRSLITGFLTASATKASGSFLSAHSDPQTYLKALSSSDIQIYWPFFENWDGSSLPVITFDPEDGSVSNVGYKTVVDASGNRSVEEVVVTETLAATHPVWVVNRNKDAGFNSLEILRRQDPSWGSGGGEVIVRPSSVMPRSSLSSSGSVKTLVLKSLTMKRNYDCWFAGASEFFVKCGSVEDFTASTEAELKLYNPSVTDFMIVVKRSFLNVARPVNAILVSEWTDQLEECAFMLSEDDGGTRTSWACTAVVKYKSRSYGFDVNLPFNSHDDIVWRGKLSRKYFERYNNVTGHFGDVDLVFQIIDSR